MGEVKRPILHYRTKFRKDQPNRCLDIAMFVIFKMVYVAILDFQKFDIYQLMRCMRHYAKFHQNRSIDCRNMAISRFFFKMAAVGHVLGLSAKTTGGLCRCAKFG